MRALLGLPGEGRLAGHGAFHRAGEREHRQHDPVLRHREVVDHRRERTFQDLGARHLAVPVDGLQAHFLGEASGGRVAEEDHLAGLGIELGMRRERAVELVAVGLVAAVGADRHQARRIERVGCVCLLERQEATRVPDDVGVGDGGVEREDARVGVAWVAEGAGEAFAFLVLHLPLGRAHPAVLVGDVAVLDVEGVDHAVAAEPVVGPARRELRVGLVAVERAAELARHLAGDLKVARVGLAVHRTVVAVQEGIVGREGLGHGGILLLRRSGNAVYLIDAINTHRFPQVESGAQGRILAGRLSLRLK